MGDFNFLFQRCGIPLEYPWNTHNNALIAKSGHSLLRFAGKNLDPASLNIFAPPPPDAFSVLKAAQGEGGGGENKRIRFAEEEGPVFSGDLPGRPSCAI